MPGRHTDSSVVVVVLNHLFDPGQERQNEQRDHQTGAHCRYENSYRCHTNEAARLTYQSSSQPRYTTPSASVPANMMSPISSQAITVDSIRPVGMPTRLRRGRLHARLGVCQPGRFEKLPPASSSHNGLWCGGRVSRPGEAAIEAGRAMGTPGLGVLGHSAGEFWSKAGSAFMSERRGHRHVWQHEGVQRVLGR